MPLMSVTALGVKLLGKNKKWHIFEMRFNNKQLLKGSEIACCKILFVKDSKTRARVEKERQAEGSLMRGCEARIEVLESDSNASKCHSAIVEEENRQRGQVQQELKERLFAARPAEQSAHSSSLEWQQQNETRLMRLESLREEMSNKEMGIELDANRAKMEEQSAAFKAQLEVELPKVQQENRKLRREHEQATQDAVHSEKRDNSWSEFLRGQKQPQQQQEAQKT
eukprot:1157583-Amphidinium_carterae.1